MKTTHASVLTTSFTLPLTLTLSLLAASAQAQVPAQVPAQNTTAGPALNPQAARITDTAIHTDYATYARQQGAIKALNDTGRHRVASYSLAKAQCWLDVSFHEYSRNDRSAFPQGALTESFRITDYLAKGGSVTASENPANQTPLVNNAAKLRPDLWERAAKLKGHQGLRCAEQRLACAEVELVHAGNEHNQQQWRHAKPYVQIAEDLMGEAEAAAQACVPPPAPAPVAIAAPPPPPVVAPAPPPPPPVVVAPAPRAVQREATVLFNFDRRDLANVRPLTKDTVDRLVAEVKSGWQLQRVVLTGHADISNNTRDNSYNVRLAQDRAQTVKAYLISQGIPANLISTEARADSAQVVSCDAKRLKKADYEECLLPNRRVEVRAEGTVPGR